MFKLLRLFQHLTLKMKQSYKAITKINYNHFCVNTTIHISCVKKSDDYELFQYH